MIHVVKPYTHHFTGMSRTFKGVTDTNKLIIFLTIRMGVEELAVMIKDIHLQ